MSVQTFTDCAAQTGQSETLATTVLVEDPGRTTMTCTVLYPSQEIRDSVINSGMEHGAVESHDKLAEYLASIA